jgi:gluconolactonase
MITTRKKGLFLNTVLVTAIVALIVSVTGCGKSEPAWTAVNKRLVQENKIQERVREDVPKDSPIVANLPDGEIKNISTLPKVELYPGVTAQMYWNPGNLIAWMDLTPGAEIPSGALPGDRIMVVWKGSVQQLINGNYVEMIARERQPATGTTGGTPRKEFVYLQQGTQHALRAGTEGARIVEVWWPVRLDYLEKAGVHYAPEKVPVGTFPVPPSHQPNKVYDLFDVQWTELVPYANSRIISSRGAQMSFLRMDPGSDFAYHNHPEIQNMYTIRGWINERILDRMEKMQAGDCLYLPVYFVHGGVNGPLGCDVLDVFYPPRTDYNASRLAALKAYHEIIPEDAEIRTVIDGATQGPGLNFTEGPKWFKGKLYFSNMYFDTNWNGDPAKSSTVEMDPDGKYRYIQKGKMMTNGIMPMANGNLAVCDMFGHRIIEMTTSGNVVRTLVSQYNGVRIDGPNDLAIDAKGGIYFTDPQFIADKPMQPGKQVFYRKPNGDIALIAGPGEFGQPNGIVLSPDGKTLYVNNTFHDANHKSDAENYLIAYDVKDDGTVSNRRRHGELRLTENVLDAQERSTSADGMTVDTEGNIYVATFAGVQIVNPAGKNIGTIHFPVFPVSICFGGEDMKTLYVAAYNKIYSIRTNKTGLKYPLGSR